ncbi:exported hypothetical protein [Imperialibacter sp. EC-SDR9]|uniref:beta strand repeat-containing protein n=2 Tax=unclassified Imperialibacter TaxID=2629706 RepID=UPI001256C946|nr:hypothetical protein [Imperialibacter sp. EC-SDR9]VVT28016.1 exported hypothetical protein [Imperialibacter sp. EC-SDR9]
MAVRPNLKAAVGLILLLLSGTVSAQNFSAGVNTENPNPRAVLHLVSPNGDQGLLIPQLTTAQRTSMAGGLNAQSNGLLVYDNEQGLFYFWLNSGWIALSVTDNQTLAVSGTNLTIQNGNSVDLAATGFLLAETDPTVPDAIKDGIDWTELTNIPAGFADGVDEVGSSAGDGTTILGDGNTTPFSVGVIDIAQVTGLATIAASGSFNDLADVPANLDVDNTDDLSTSAVPAPGDVSGSFALGLVVDQVGGEAAADVGAATFFVINNPSIDPDFSDDLTLSDTPSGGDVSGDFGTGLVVDFVGGEAAADVGAATFFVINNPFIDPDFSDDLTLSDTPSGGDVSGDFGTGLVVDFVGSETASDVATATALVIANPTLDLDASDDFDGAYGSLTGVSVVNADVNAAAAIAGTKINPNFGTQAITTTGAVTGASFSGDGSGLTNVTATNFTGGLAGDVTGTQGATVIANDAVNSTKILDGTIANIDVSGTAAIAGTKIAPNFGTQAITTTGAVTGASFSGDGSGLTNVTATNFTGGLAGDVTGTQGATVIANDAVNSTKILDGTIANIDVSGTAAIAGTKIAPNFGNQAITTTGAVTGASFSGDGSGLTNVTATNFTGALAGDVTGTQGATVIANDAVNSTKILDGTIANIDVSGTAAIAGTKIAPNFGTQAITTTGAVTGASFSGDGSGLTNVTATNFTGALAGDVTGSQGATVVSNVSPGAIAAGGAAAGDILEFDGANWVPVLQSTATLSDGTSITGNGTSGSELTVAAVAPGLITAGGAAAGDILENLTEPTGFLCSKARRLSVTVPA